MHCAYLNCSQPSNQILKFNPLESIFSLNHLKFQFFALRFLDQVILQIQLIVGIHVQVQLNFHLHFLEQLLQYFLIILSLQLH